MTEFKRFRHRRLDEATREQFRETAKLKAAELIWPVFVVEGKNRKEEVGGMFDVFRMSADILCEELAPLVAKGLEAILVFGVPSIKGIEQAWAADGVVQKSVAMIKKQFPALEVITDVCLCSYTDDGHCHVGDNDETCRILARVALSHARAGADAVAPSDMMDGRVHFIRKELDANGMNTPIMSYSAKFASAYYGPFRDAADCAPQHGDRKSYQMDYANGSEALEEIAADIDEGASSVIVKPALAYLDIIANAASRFDVPIIAYNVSGEYQALNLLVKSGGAAPSIIDETLLSFKRAGASRIITYFAPAVIKEMT